MTNPTITSALPHLKVIATMGFQLEVHPGLDEPYSQFFIRVLDALIKKNSAFPGIFSVWAFAVNPTLPDGSLGSGNIRQDILNLANSGKSGTETALLLKEWGYPLGQTFIALHNRGFTVHYQDGKLYVSDQTTLQQEFPDDSWDDSCDPHDVVRTAKTAPDFATIMATLPWISWE